MSGLYLFQSELMLLFSIGATIVVWLLVFKLWRDLKSKK